MAEYKPRQYTSKTLDYNTRIPAKNLDTRVKLYEPSRPIKDIPPVRTYDTKPPTHIRTRTYDKVKAYEYKEYVPPWSRGKEKGKKKMADPRVTAEKGTGEEREVNNNNDDSREAKVTFVPLPTILEKEGSLQTLGSVKRMLDLFHI